MSRISRLTALVAAIAGLGTAAAPASETVTYSYDALGRLVKVEHSGTVNNGVRSDYAYDKAGNRANVTVTGAANARFCLITVPLGGLTPVVVRNCPGP